MEKARCSMSVMPMFPLGSVLFPHMPLDLRIFEERYLKLLGDLMMDDNPEFGVVLIERGPEVGGGENRHAVGTVAQVTDIGTTDEFYGLQSVGGQRFRVNTWLPDDPYPIADIDLLPELIWTADLMPLRQQVEASVRKLLAVASEFADLQYNFETLVSDDPIEACWQLAGVLPVGPLDQIDMLQSPTASDLLYNIQRIVKDANETLAEMMKNQPDEDWA